MASDADKAAAERPVQYAEAGPVLVGEPIMGLPFRSGDDLIGLLDEVRQAKPEETQPMLTRSAS